MNEKIGLLGERFIQKRVELGLSFDEAWDDWQRIQDRLMFLIECPEVQCYDDRRVSDCQKRQRLRDLAKSKLGDDIRSPDVSMLGRVAAWMQLEVPIHPYQMDRSLVAEWVAGRIEAMELEYGIDEVTAEAREMADSGELTDQYMSDIQTFAQDHGLWAVLHVAELTKVYTDEF